jgi:hypothetical protein
MSKGAATLLAVATLWAAAAAGAAGPSGWRFVEVARAAGLDYEHGMDGGPVAEPHWMSGGVAAGDFDGDGWCDLYVVRGRLGPNLLFRNLGDGSFEEVGAAWGLALEGELGSGPTFADFDGDGRLDLLIGGVGGTPPRLFRNRGTFFEQITAASGVVSVRDTFSSAFGDYDRDGDLDLFLAHWSFGSTLPLAPHLWRNDGGGRFEPVDWRVGIAQTYLARDLSFTPAFTDLDADGWPDLFVTGDFGTTQVFRNLGRGEDGEVRFAVATSPVISDENGMGLAVGDVDGDLDLDVFVSSIWDPDGNAEGNWGVTGNRLYRNRGDGGFDDATETAGVRAGFWGWGSCFADLDNDGDLDLFHTNGFQAHGADDFHTDPTRLFLNRGDGRFSEHAEALGITDRGQGRGVVCFDYDRDGDVDLFIAQNGGPPLLYRNELPPGAHFLALRLVGVGPNREAIGARVIATAGGRRQLRELRAGSSYLSQDPALVHLGLGGATRADEVEIRWPDGQLEVYRDLAADRLHVLEQGGAVAVPTLRPLGSAALTLLLLVAGWRLLRRRDALQCTRSSV